MLRAFLLSKISIYGEFMRTYPSVVRGWRKHPEDEVIYAFDKLDGTCIRSEWSRKKKKFWKFGTRQLLIDETHGHFGESLGLIKAKYERDLHDIFIKQGYQKVICFFEFYGENSFAGTHYDEEHFVTLFDVSPHKKGLLEPKDFLKTYGHLDIPKMLYHGIPTKEFMDSVRDGRLEGMTFEGVVCKGKYVSPGLPLLYKLKNKEWFKRLREKCNGDEKLFEQLA